MEKLLEQKDSDLAKEKALFQQQLSEQQDTIKRLQAMVKEAQEVRALQHTQRNKWHTPLCWME